MELKIDPAVDAARVRVAKGTYAYTADVSRGRYYERGIDYDAEDHILGYEFLNVSKGVDLSDLPHRDALAALFAERGVRILEAT